MFTSVLVANRGEIAVRIIRTLRSMGIRSVLAASVPDRRGFAARNADEVVVLEGYSAAETYLEIDLIIAAAKSAGCDAIHPGYGFLSENADFAERCGAERIVFVGPAPVVLRALGDKSAARQLAIATGVPVVPGYDGPDDLESLAKAVEAIGYPVMVKARGGGGGRGMREVHDPADLHEAVESARREALAAFGDGRLLLEKLVKQAHHVEVQVLADAHGNIVHLGERDCSVQRRRQKLIEESPSPVVDEPLRERLTAAALQLARAAGYINAGTVEFLVGQPGFSGERPFYFLEVNPRLQVEHPVTEMRTGLDLVELQLRIASGESLSFSQADIKFEGHAVEFRINAEDPWNDFRPSSGRIGSTMSLNGGAGWRGWDAGYERSDSVPGQYDSLLAKFVASGGTREDVLAEALKELGDSGFGGIRTNLGLHIGALHSGVFRRGEATIDWLERDLDAVLDRGVAPDEWFAAAATALAPHLGTGSGTAHLTDEATLRHVVLCGISPTRLEARVAGRPLVLNVEERTQDYMSVRAARSALVVSVRDSTATVWQGDKGGRFSKWEHVTYRRFSIVPPPPLPRRPQAAAAGAALVTAPLAGTVSAVRIREGDPVEAGQVLLLLEAMKMEHRITAESAGTVLRVAARQGDVVREGDILVELSPP